VWWRIELARAAMVTRAVGANEALRGGAPRLRLVVEKLIVHHTATPSDPSDPAAVARDPTPLDGGVASTSSTTG
jgi:hypothetical protein